ncbi:MAG: hypothetical protein JXX14_19315 [Deltaproteobacteria bacterium]|nr:hypothetical protein [Deltaproteobacteria bacterium]
MTEEKFECDNCNAELRFEPGINALICPYCDTENKIDAGVPDEVKELDYLAHLKNAEASSETTEVITVTCDACKAELTFEPNITSDQCPFCANDINAQQHSRHAIKPRSLLPFKVTVEESRAAFLKWVKSRWFAPGKLRRDAKMSKMAGVYMPFWTYDTNTTSDYSGSRGEYYYVSQTYTTTVNGKRVTRTRQVRRTRWYPASGTVNNAFDDILVVASTALPLKFAQKLDPWDLENLVPYTADYLQGFRVQSYSLGLEAGFAEAKEQITPVIRKDVYADIGGDTQRIHSIQTRYNNVTFKHILLPVWINAYRFKNRQYRILVNARTGEVQGERPWSWVKIALFSLTILGIIGAAAYFFSNS